MKKVMLVFMVMFSFSLLVSAQTLSDDAFAPVDMLNQVVNFLAGIPVVGNYVVFIMSSLFLVSNVATIIASAWVSIGKLLVGTLNLVGAGVSADKVEAFMKSLAPWIKYFSAYNVKKPLVAPWKSNA